MDFNTLNTLIPHALGEKLHVLSMSPYNAITLALPGRHQKDTPIPGGDFVVMVDDSNMGWIKHQFTHDDLFADIELKTSTYSNPGFAQTLMQDYAAVVMGADPEAYSTNLEYKTLNKVGLHPLTFLYATQCLAVAEHRRYGQHEKRGGGRFLPARFSSGIVEGLWTAEDCKKVQRKGRMGLDLLISQYGHPTSIKELANA